MASYLKRNLSAYLVSMRWQYSFIPAFAGLIGISFSVDSPTTTRQITILGILFVGWGINQVINDYFGIEEDRHNAPRRPMVNGSLNIGFALCLSSALFLIGAVMTLLLNKEAIWIYIFIFALNLAYERAKKVPLLGNIAFGLLIAPCVFYSAVCAGKGTIAGALTDKTLLALALLVWLANTVFCFFTDFKDFLGDKKAGINTLVAALGQDKAKYLGLLLAMLPYAAVFYFQSFLEIIPRTNPLLLSAGIFCFLITAVIIFFNAHDKKETSRSLVWATVGVLLFEIGLCK
mgnify:CR=1 FL=1